MKIRGIGRLRRAARWFRYRFAHSALILIYHRVAALASDPQLLCVMPEHFADHLQILRKYGHPMGLQELTRELLSGNIPDRAIVITFDDGYADNLYNAKPLLDRYDIPATVFVTTGYLEQNRELWWDELDRLLLQSGVLPEQLGLTVNGRVYQWDLEEAAHYNADGYRQHLSWNVLEKDDPTPRHSLYRILHQLLRALTEEERQKVLDELLAWAGVESMARPTHRVLSPDEVFSLAEGGLVEVGGHTVTHPRLSKLPLPAQKAEIQQCKTRLEEILGHPVASFSYPYGTRSAYTLDTVTLVQKEGFTCACSNFADVVWKRTDPYQLPRFLVWDWDGDEFERRLKEWFDG